MDSGDSARRMEALYYRGVKRTKVCSLHFRREDSRNYLNGRIPERWFCFKFALSVLLPRKGKQSPEWVNPLLWLKNPQELSGTLLCMKCLQRGRMFSQSSGSCVFKSLNSAIKVTIFGKPLLVYHETLRQVAEMDHVQGQIQCSNLSLPEPFSFLLLS